MTASISMTTSIRISSLPSGRITRGRGWVPAVVRHFSRWHYLHAIEVNVPARGEILEFGCGGGDAFIPSRFRATGLDIDFEAARSVGQCYQHSINANVCALPFRSSSFDAVASSFVLEHLPLREAESGLGEIHRVLRSGGVLICLCDLDCDHPMLAVLRRFYPGAYCETFVEVPGHWGLRRESAWARLLEEAGFETHYWRLMSRFPILDHAPWAYLASGARMPEYLKRVGRLAHRISNWGRTGAIWGLAVVLLDDAFRFLLPRSWAYRLLFVALKSRD